MLVLRLVARIILGESAFGIRFHYLAAPHDTQCFLYPFLRIREQIQAAVDPGQGQLFERHTQTHLAEEILHAFVQCIELTFFCLEYPLGLIMPIDQA